MAKRGRKPKGGIARAAAPNLNLRSLKATRKSAGGQMPVHFKQVAFKRDGRAVAGMRKRQNYIERDQAAEPVDLAALEKSGLAKSAERFVDAGGAHDTARASFGTLGETAAERRAFWAQIDALERDNARVQYGIIAELPHEVSQGGRLEIMRDFCADEFEPRALPYWATAHRPDAHNDPRNYHVHILYYARPGRRTASGWRFDKPGEIAKTDGQPIVAREYPWGKERPMDRVKRLARRFEATTDQDNRDKLQRQISEARTVAEQRATRNPEVRGGTGNKSRQTYPWGLEKPTTRKKRLEKQVEAGGKEGDLKRWKRQVGEVEAYLADPETATRATAASSLTVDDKEWVAHLRDAWCRACNRVLEKEGHAKRYHPGGYKALGLDAEPTAKLGTKAAALEAQGIVTVAGRENTERVLRQLLKAGVDIDAAAANAAADTIGRRAAWASNELAEAERQANDERAAYWRREEETARRLAAAINERVETHNATESHVILADRLREIPKISSALPVPDQPEAGTISVRANTSALAAALASRMAPEALADNRDPFAPPAPLAPPATRAPPTEPVVTPPPVEPKDPELPPPASPPAPTTPPVPTPGIDATPAMHPYDRDEVVKLLLGREKAVERQLASPPTRRAYRVRPDITVEERQEIRTSLMDRTPSELRLAGRHTRNALKKATNPYERAALETGLSTLGEAYALSMTGARRNAVTRKIALDDTIRGLSDCAKTVRMLAAQLALDLPQLRERVSSVAKQRGSAEDMVAIDGALALQKLREKNKAANQTATDLQAAVRGLDQAYKKALATGSANGGYAREHKLALTTISYKTSTAVAWIPPLPDDDRTVRRRVEDALHAGRLPIPFKRKKPDLKARLKKDQAWIDEQNHKREMARQTAAAATDAAAPATPVGGSTPAQKAPSRPTGPAR